LKKNIIGTIVLLTFFENTHAACTYKFDASPTQISNMNRNETFKIFPKIIEQNFSFRLEGEGDKSNIYRATSSKAAQEFSSHTYGFVGDKSIPLSGKIGIEFLVNDFVNKYDRVHSLEKLNMIGTGFSFILSDDHKYLNYGDISVIDERVTRHIGVMIQGNNPNKSNHFMGENYMISKETTKEIRFGLIIDQDNKKIDVNINGDYKGSIASLSGKPTKISLFVDGYSTNIEPKNPFIGQTISAELITDQSNMKLNYKVGTTDLCGSPL
jgi:hypothetical protein